jgi:hypothetical protein
MNAQFAFIGQFLLQSAMLSAVLLATYDIAKHSLRLEGMLALCGAVFLFYSIGYAAFWLAFASYAVFSFAKIVVLALLLFRVGLAIYRRRLRSSLGEIGEPLLYIFLFAGAVLAVGFSNGGLDVPPITAATRFSPPLPPDNIIPYVFAEGLKLPHVPSPMLGDWLSSDRPPLQAGLYLAFTVQTGERGYQILGSWLQATFLLGVWAVAAAAGYPTTTRRLVMLACCLTSNMIINTFFVWPKLVTIVALTLVFVLLFCYRPASKRQRIIAGVMLGGLAAFAVLCHSGSAFALIGMGVLTLATWRWPSWKTLLFAMLTVVVLYTPWVAYQKFIDPPGNRLLKWHLAGVVLKIDNRSFLQALRDGYGALSWSDYVYARRANLQAQVGSWPNNLLDLAKAVFQPSPALLRKIRINDFFFLLPSLHVFSIALIAAIAVYLSNWWAGQRQNKIPLYLFGTSALSCLAAVVLEFVPGSAVNHQSTYAVQVMAIAATFMMLSARCSMLAGVFIALQTITVATVYAVTLPHSSEYLPLQLMSIIMAGAILTYSLYPVDGRVWWRPRNLALSDRDIFPPRPSL